MKKKSETANPLHVHIHHRNPPQTTINRPTKPYHSKVTITQTHHHRPTNPANPRRRHQLRALIRARVPPRHPQPRAPIQAQVPPRRPQPRASIQARVPPHRPQPRAHQPPRRVRIWGSKERELRKSRDRERWVRLGVGVGCVRKGRLGVARQRAKAESRGREGEQRQRKRKESKTEHTRVLEAKWFTENFSVIHFPYFTLRFSGQFT